MKRVLLALLTGLVTSFLLFPFNLPIEGIQVNTKMLLAVAGVGLFVFDKIQGRCFTVSRDFLILSLICSLISIWAFAVAIWNNTSDYAFSKYIISVWVWLGAAYAVYWMIRFTHAGVTVERIGYYLGAVCTAQCLLAYAMTIWPTLGSNIDSLMGESEAFMGVAENRLHGLGAALDPAGLRFSAVLIILAHLITQTDFSKKPLAGILSVCSFIIVSIIGNMIARTTTVGMVMSIVYLILKFLQPEGVTNPSALRSAAIPVTVLGIGIAVMLYNASPQFRTDLRFGFEGFFSFVETGKWEVHSNDLLKEMIVWPESLKTWVIGDGYFDSPQDSPNRFGQIYTGFYKKTDIGYLRYIFYFGMIGLIGMIAVFFQMMSTCIRKMPKYTILFLFLLILNLIGWLKVSSDIIMVFAPMVILSYLTKECISSTT